MANVLRMSEATALGLHAATAAASEEGPVTMASIARGLSASEAHLSKVLQTLVRAGLLESRRGPNGGYKLTRSASQITLLDVYEAFEGPVRTDGCLFARPVCDRVRCILGGLVEDVRSRVAEYLRETTLEEASKGRRR
jgi:Rrf2 family protein